MVDAHRKQTLIQTRSKKKMHDNLKFVVPDKKYDRDDHGRFASSGVTKDQAEKLSNAAAISGYEKVGHTSTLVWRN